jgi:hypothetical protein
MDEKILHITGDYGIDEVLTKVIKILELLNEGFENSFREPGKAYIYHGKIKQRIRLLKERQEDD